jgi:hypothetical protein
MFPRTYSRKPSFSNIGFEKGVSTKVGAMAFTLILYFAYSMAQDAGHVLSMILMPTPSRDLLARLLDEGVVHDKKEDIPDPNPQPLEELMQGGFRNLLHGPDILSQESSEAGEGSVQKKKS